MSALKLVPVIATNHATTPAMKVVLAVVRVVVQATVPEAALEVVPVVALLLQQEEEALPAIHLV